MTLKCQGCGSEITDEQLESLDSEYVAHNYPAPDGFGQITDYYCNPGCLSDSEVNEAK